MAMVEQSQVWVGSEDSVIYIISIHSMSCNKQLADHRASITGLVVPDGTEAPRYAGLVGGVTCGARRGEGVRCCPCPFLVLGTEARLLRKHSGLSAGSLCYPPCPRVSELSSVLGQAQVRWT